MLRTVPGPPYHSRPRSGVVIGRHTSYDAAPKRGEDMSDADETPERDLDRKDRLVQTRVPRGLESTLKREARRRRLTVSHLIRNILEDALQLVDDVVANVDEIVTDSVEIARRVKRDARRVANAVRDAAESQEGERPPDPLGHVYGWSCVVLNRAATCSRCGAGIARGAEGWTGLSDDPAAPRAWLCTPCRDALHVAPPSNTEE